MSRKIFLLLLTVGLVIACEDKKAPKQQEADTVVAQQPAPEVPKVSVRDTTIYGVATEDFGMSTFAIKADDGSSVEVMRTREDGTDGRFYGDVKVGDRYAMTTTDGGSSLGTAINVTQLERCTHDYSIVNAQLVLHPTTHPDTVKIIHLNAQKLVAEGREKYTFPATRKGKAQ